MQASLPIINQGYELFKSFALVNDHLSKRWRFSLGQSTETSILTLLEYFIIAKNAPKPMKAAYLLKASSKLEVLSFKLRLMLELGLVNETRIFQLQAQVREIGRMLGGWLKASQA